MFADLEHRRSVLPVILVFLLSDLQTTSFGKHMTDPLDKPSRQEWVAILALPFVGTAFAFAVSTYIYFSDIGG